MLELGREEAVEVVFDDEDAEEVGVAVGAEDVPREGGEAETGDGYGVKAAKGVAPAFGQERPEEYCSTGENYRCWTFGENGEAKKQPEEDGCEGG